MIVLFQRDAAAGTETQTILSAEGLRKLLDLAEGSVRKGSD